MKDCIKAVLVVDDNELMSMCVRKILSHLFPSAVVSVAGNGREAVRMSELSKFDLVLMDLSMPEMNGVDATRYFTRHHPNTVVLAMSMSDERDSVIQAMQAGARGYLLKTSLMDEMGLAISAAMEGGSPYMSPGLLTGSGGMQEDGLRSV